MKEALFKNRAVLIVGLVCLVLGFALSAIFLDAREVEVSVGDVAVKVGEGTDPETMGLSEAIGEIYKTTEENSQKLAELSAATATANVFINKSIVREINKQHGKITDASDPGDVKAVDIEAVIDDWSTLSDAYKTQAIIYKYDIISTWYKEHL